MAGRSTPWTCRAAAIADRSDARTSLRHRPGVPSRRAAATTRATIRMRRDDPRREIGRAGAKRPSRGGVGGRAGAPPAAAVTAAGRGT